MGHYRGEMGYEEDDKRQAEEKAARIAASTARIQAAIDAKGVAAVLAEMISDTTLFAVRYR